MLVKRRKLEKGRFRFHGRTESMMFARLGSSTRNPRLLFSVDAYRIEPVLRQEKGFL